MRVNDDVKIAVIVTPAIFVPDFNSNLPMWAGKETLRFHADAR